MKKTCLLSIILTLVLLTGCRSTGNSIVEDAVSPVADKKKVAILQSWHGEYPVAQLDLLSEKQRKQGVGFIVDTEAFAAVWKAFKPGTVIPLINFDVNLVLFVHNTQFYNRISIGQVTVQNGVAEVLAMETMSAMPIEDTVAMSMAVVAREDIEGLKAGDDVIKVPGI